MPYFRYTAEDTGGRMLDGTVEANTVDQATYALHLRGLRVTSISGGPAPIATVGPAASAPHAPVRATAPSLLVTRTRSISDASRHFLFLQLSQQLKAGIAPSQALQTIARHLRLPELHEALLAASRETAEGKPLSDALARYPDLFPSNVVGSLRAGEVGGFLPQAAEVLAEQAGTAHRFKRFFWFVWVLAANALIAIPMMFWLTRSLLGAYDRYEAGSGEGAIPSEMMARLPVLLAVLVFITFLVFFLRWWFGRLEMRGLRHRLGLKWPIFGARARLENLSYFSWVLSMISRSGIVPNVAWALAANAVPNDAVRDELLVAGAKMREGSRLSEAMVGTLFPEQFVGAVATGEMVGDVPGALDQMTLAGKAEFETAQTYAKVRGGCWGALALAVTSGILLILFFKFWYQDLVHKVIGDDISNPTFETPVSE